MDEFDLLSLQPGDTLELAVGSNTWSITRGPHAQDHTNRVSGFSVMTNDDSVRLGSMPSEVRLTRFVRLSRDFAYQLPGALRAETAGVVVAGFLYDATTEAGRPKQVL